MSALGQPLKVGIMLTAVSEAEANSLQVHLASPEAFKAAGLDYPYSLSKLKFEMSRQDGQPVVLVTSHEPVNDLSVTLLVEVTWSSGKLQHEYTFLLDPPDYKAEVPQPEAVKPIEPIVAAPLPVSAPAPTAPPATEMAASAPVAAAPAAVVPAAAPPEAASAPAAAASAVPAAVTAPAEVTAAPVPQAAEVPPPAAEARAVETITVRRGDTLSTIAAQTKEPDVTVEQMLVALYRANVKQFDGRNMNRLRAGKILRMPDPSALEKLSQRAAVKEIRIQTADWNAYRQKLATAAAPAVAQEPKQEASGKISATVKTPPPKENGKEVLKLSKGEAPGDKTAAAGKAQPAQEKANAKQEEAIAKGKAQQEAGNRAAALEKNVQQMQKLVQLEGQPAAPAKPGAAAPAAPKPVQPPKKPALAAPAAPAETSLVDDVLDTVGSIFGGAVDFATENPLYLGGFAALVIAAGAGIYVFRRRGQGMGRILKKKS